MTFLSQLFRSRRSPDVTPVSVEPDLADTAPVQVMGEFCSVPDHDHGIIDSSRHVSSIGQR